MRGLLPVAPHSELADLSGPVTSVTPAWLLYRSGRNTCALFTVIWFASLSSFLSLYLEPEAGGEVRV